MSHTIAIIGGGISGLSTAWFLEQFAAEAGLEIRIELFEARDRPGGKISTRYREGMVIETGAESFLSRKPHGVGLCQALGIDGELTGTRPATKKTFVWYNERMHALPAGLSGFVPGNPAAILSTTLLSPLGKLRVALDYLKPARQADSDEPLATFISRRLGRQACERLVQPLLCGIYGADGSELSLQATYPELQTLVREHGGLIRGLGSKKRASTGAAAKWPAFVTLPGGMSQLIDVLKGALRRTTLRTGSPVASLAGHADGYELAGESHRFDAVVVTASAARAAPMLHGFSPDLSAELKRIPHVSTATVNLWFEAAGFRHPLDGYGFVIPAGRQNGITAVTWTSSKHYHRAPADKRLIRVYVGRAGTELDPSTTDDEIMTVVRRELKRTMSIEEIPAGVLIQRWPGGSPQYTMGHLDRLAAIDRRLQDLPGLFLTGSSYRGVGIPDCIRQAEQAAGNAMAFLQRRADR